MTVGLSRFIFIPGKSHIVLRYILNMCWQRYRAVNCLLEFVYSEYDKQLKVVGRLAGLMKECTAAAWSPHGLRPHQINCALRLRALFRPCLNICLVWTEPSPQNFPQVSACFIYCLLGVCLDRWIFLDLQSFNYYESVPTASSREFLNNMIFCMQKQIDTAKKEGGGRVVQSPLI